MLLDKFVIVEEYLSQLMRPTQGQGGQSESTVISAAQSPSIQIFSFYILLKSAFHNLMDEYYKL